MKLYALKSKSLNWINQPFVAENDHEVLFRIRDAIQRGEDVSLAKNVADLQLVILADFNSTEGLYVDRRQIQWNADTATLIPQVVDYDLASFLPKLEVKPDAEV